MARRIPLTEYLKSTWAGSASWRLDVAILALIMLAAAAVLVWTDPGYPVDDATITYRYAQNIAKGKGFVYNEGERVLGTSTPMYTLLMAGIALLGLDLVLAGRLIGVLAALLCCLIVYAICRAVGGRFAAALGSGLLATSAHFAANASSGMETPLYTFLVLLTMYAYIKGHVLTAVMLSGLCVCTRLDGAAVGTAVLLALVWGRRRLPWKEGILLAAVLMPWFLFSLSYFGDALPASMIAKQHHALTYGRLWMIRFLLNSPFELLWLPILVYAIEQGFQHHVSRVIILPVWMVLYVLAYSVVGIDMYDWYNVPLLPIVYALCGLGVARILGTLGSPRVWRWGGAILLLFVLAYQAKYTVALVPAFRRQAVAVEGTRTEVGIWLGENTAPNARIATDGIGHIGYYSGRYIVDLAGLVTPFAVGKSYDEILSHFLPEYAVSVLHPNSGHPFESPWFRAHYTLIKQWDGTAAYYGPHMLYRLRSEKEASVSSFGP